MAKHPKLDVAETAAYVEDLRHNMANQRDSISRLEEKTVFGDATPPRSQTTGDEMGNFIVCDDYHVDNSTRPQESPRQSSPSSNAPLIAALVAATAIAAYALAPKADMPQPTPAVPAVSADDNDTRYLLEFIE